MRRTIYLSLPLLFLCLAKGHANTVDTVKLAVNNYVAEQVSTVYPDIEDFKISYGYLDNQISLAACTEALNIEKNSGQINHGRLSVTVTCAAPNWKINIPLQIKLYKEIAVSNDYLKKGKIISPNDISFVKQDIARLSTGYFEKLDDVVGKVVFRSIRQGSLIKPNMLRERTLVNRGKTVNIISLAPGIEVKASGIALQDGIAGEIVSVKNLATNRTIEGVVTGPDTITIQL